MKIRKNWYIILFSFLLGATIVTDFSSAHIMKEIGSVTEISEEEVFETDIEGLDVLISTQIKYTKKGGNNPSAVFEPKAQSYFYIPGEEIGIITSPSSIRSGVDDLYLLYCSLKLHC